MPEKQKQVKFSCSCDPTEEMGFREMMAHMKEAHSEDIEGKRVTSEMMSHVDAETWYSTIDKITTAGRNVFFRHVVCER